MPDEENRSLTDADVEAIVDALEGRLAKKIYNDVGKGVLGMVWKGVLVALVWLAAYGAAKGMK